MEEVPSTQHRSHGLDSRRDFQNWAQGAIITLALRLPSSVVEQLTCNEQVIRSIRMGGSAQVLQR